MAKGNSLVPFSVLGGILMVFVPSLTPQISILLKGETNSFLEGKYLTMINFTMCSILTFLFYLITYGSFFMVSLGYMVNRLKGILMRSLFLTAVTTSNSYWVKNITEHTCNNKHFLSIIQSGLYHTSINTFISLRGSFPYTSIFSQTWWHQPSWSTAQYLITWSSWIRVTHRLRANNLGL